MDPLLQVRHLMAVGLPPMPEPPGILPSGGSLVALCFLGIFMVSLVTPWVAVMARRLTRQRLAARRYVDEREKWVGLLPVLAPCGVLAIGVVSILGLGAVIVPPEPPLLVVAAQVGVAVGTLLGLVPSLLLYRYSHRRF
ncbi:hypothetical protein GCM10009756_03390 [Pseudokineococcus marinus]